MAEAFLLELLAMAERWAGAAGSTLRDRQRLAPTVFAVTRRPEERAMLAAAVEVYDLIGATPVGATLMRELGLGPDAGGLLSERDLIARWEAWRASVRTGAVAAEPTSTGEG